MTLVISGPTFVDVTTPGQITWTGQVVILSVLFGELLIESMQGFRPGGVPAGDVLVLELGGGLGSLMLRSDRLGRHDWCRVRCHQRRRWRRRHHRTGAIGARDRARQRVRL